VTFENIGSPLSNVMRVIDMSCIVQEIWTYEIESISLNHPVYIFILALLNDCNITLFLMQTLFLNFTLIFISDCGVGR